jgi:hypothetical protein
MATPGALFLTNMLALVLTAGAKTGLQASQTIIKNCASVCPSGMARIPSSKSVFLASLATKEIMVKMSR